MDEDIIASGGRGSSVMTGLLIAAPFFLFLYYAKVSSDRIKELKDKLELAPTIITTGAGQQQPGEKVIIQQDTALVNRNTELVYENRMLEEKIDSVLKLLVVNSIPPPSAGGNDNMFEDSFKIYKGYYLSAQQQLINCHNEKGKLLLNMKNYRIINPGVTN